MGIHTLKQADKNIQWDYCVEVLVVGSGFAGLSAAIEASENSASVLVIEKMKSYGGNSIISDGGIAAPETDIQKKYGITDSPKMMYDDMLKAGLGLNNKSLLKTLTEHAKKAFDWTKDILEVEYMDRVDIFGGHSVSRCYTPKGITGAAIIKRMISQADENDIEIRYSTALKSFIVNNLGAVIGAYILEDFDYKTNQGVLKTIEARNGIVLATGGYGADISFRSIQDPRLGSEIQTTNKPFATAEGIKAAIKIGAAAVQLSQIQLGAWASPDESGFGDGPLFADYILFQYGIIVNPKTGERFVNELGDRKKTADAILSIGHPCVGIADETAVKHAGWDISKSIKKGVVKVFDCYNQLAKHYDINEKKLHKTIAKYNEYVKKRKDKDYSKQIVEDALPIETFPIYAMRLWPKVHYTMGGLSINSKAQVLDFDGNVIKGLYAAGEVAGGVHGASRLGSCSITECIVFGRIAGRESVSR